MALTLMLNGHTRSFAPLETGCLLTEAIALLGLKADRIAVERNGTIVSRDRWEAVRLNDGDKLEVVHFVGGGSHGACGQTGRPLGGASRRAGRQGGLRRTRQRRFARVRREVYIICVIGRKKLGLSCIPGFRPSWVSAFVL